MPRGKRKPKVQDSDSDSAVAVLSPQDPCETIEQIETEIDQSRLELEKVRKEIAEKKAELDRLPAREIDVKEQKIIDKQISSTSQSEALKEKIAKQKAFDNVKVTGKFMNLRNPGQAVKLPYIKYDDDVVKWWPFEHGKVYTIPRGFADQLNGGTDNDPCYYMPKFTQKQGPMDPENPGSQVSEVDTSNRKYAFVPVNF